VATGSQIIRSHKPLKALSGINKRTCPGKCTLACITKMENNSFLKPIF
jgi:hypothetical protein